MPNYSDAVPAVQRTISVLEHLRQAEAAPTLTEMSQALHVNRSSLLAILNTLRSAGFVARDEADRYRLGPALLAFAPQVARAHGPLEAFEQPAQLLVDALGETVALVRLTAQGAAYVAVKMGYFGVRAVMEPGHVSPILQSAGALAVLAALPDDQAAAFIAGQQLAHHQVNEHAEQVRGQGWACVEDAFELGQVSLAAPVCSSDGRAIAAIEVLGPAYRIVGDGLRQAAVMVMEAARQASIALGCGDYTPYREQRQLWRGSHPAGLQGRELDGFLAEPWVANLACVREDGRPYTVPVWYEWREGAFWLAASPGARWACYVQAQPQVSLSISQPSPPFRRALAEGVACRVPRAPAATLEKRLAERYLGAQAAAYLRRPATEGGSVIRIVPSKITSWEGLLGHSRYAAAGAS